MSNLLNKAHLFLKRNSSSILTGIGAVGVVVTSVMAVKATPKAINIIREAKEEKGEDLTAIETIRVAGPIYIPAVISGVSTIACIFGANILNKRSQAALASAYAFLDNSYKEYKNKVSELYGDDANNNIREEIAKDKYKDYSNSFTDDKQLYFDEYSGRYFQSTPEDIQKAEYDLNRVLALFGEASVNDWLGFLGLDPIEEGSVTGWSFMAYAEVQMCWVDFRHTLTKIDDDMECEIIEFANAPLVQI